MTKCLDFALKIKGGVVGRVANEKSSDPATTKKKFGTWQWVHVTGRFPVVNEM